MKFRTLALAAALSTLLAAPAQAAIITLVGTNFDLTYDDTKLGLFGAPVLFGDTIQFTLSPFAATAPAAGGASNRNSTVSGIVLTAKDGFRFGAFDLSELGEYELAGDGSLVRVQGQLRAFNVADSLNTQTTSSLRVSASTPLTLADGIAHDWAAAARVDETTAPVPVSGGTATNVILSNPAAVGIAIDNRLTAFTDPAFTGTREAFITKTPNGVQLHVSPIPAPPAMWTFGAGLLALGFLLRCQRG
jgi:hypothetical protein